MPLAIWRKDGVMVVQKQFPLEVQSRMILAQKPKASNLGGMDFRPGRVVKPHH